MSHPAIDNLPPIHPGEILADELAALGLSAPLFAKHIGVPANAVMAILEGDRGISAPMALRLAKAFRTTPQYWTNLQSTYETKIAEASEAAEIAAIEPLLSGSR